MIPAILKRNRAKYLLAVLLLASLLAGCSANIEKTQPVQTEFLPLENGQSLGQSFTSHFNGLSAVGVILNPENSGRGAIRFSLYEAPGQETALRQVDLPLASFSYPSLTYFRFPPISGSNQQDYFFSLQWKGDQTISVAATDGSAYPDGAAYLGLEAQDKQLTFELNYGRRSMLVGLAQEMASWIMFLLAAIFLFCIPGWALLSVLYPHWSSVDNWVKIILASGVSIAIYPLFILWTDVVDLHLGAIYAWLPPILGSVIISLRNRNKLNPAFLSTIRFRLPSWSSITMFSTVCLLVLIRFWVIRTLSIPLWGDAYHHTMIAQLIVDNGGRFTDWLPYADLHTFTYHFGFHSLVAVYHWVTKLPVAQSVLWVGQMINILAVLSLYPLALLIRRNQWSGVFTILLAGFAFSMPMFYLNWARYTQLAGLCLLGIWVYITWEIFSGQKIHWKPIFLSAIVLAGLALTHYRVLIIALLFIAAYLLLNFQRKTLGTNLKQATSIGLPALLMVFPWYVNTLSGKLWGIFTNQMTTPAIQNTESFREANEIGNIFFYLPELVWALLPVILSISLWKRERGVALISLWWYIVILAANPHWLNLPGLGVLSSFTVMISLYMPASLIIGSSVGWLTDIFMDERSTVRFPNSNARRCFQAALPITLCLMSIMISFFSLSQRVQDIDIPKNSLVSVPDINAAKWVRQHLPSEARFLVNAFFAYNDTTVVGSDGGWWLPLIAGRQTTLPPMTYIAEEGSFPEYWSWVNTLVKEIQEKGINNPEVIQELKIRGIKYIYIGQKQGSMNSPGPLIQLDTIRNDSQFEVIYHQDRVWIFKIKD